MLLFSLQVKKLADMGFDPKKCLEALKQTKGNEQAAVDILMSSS
jgi:hypothetical protein